jgi:para-aminobenzoate synthetase component 1
MKLCFLRGSILGAPKPKTLEIILEAETYERGFTTGKFAVILMGKI